MAKAFLDAIQGPGGLITNDMLIQHMTLEKHKLLPGFPGAGGSAFLVGIRIAQLDQAWGSLGYQLADFASIPGTPPEFVP